MDRSQILDWALKSAGGSQAELARLMGRSESSVSRWFNGKGDPDYESCLRLARLTQISAAAVLRVFGLDHTLIAVPDGEAGEQVEPEDAELAARMERLQKLLAPYPRPFWLSIIEANEHMVEGAGSLKPPEPTPPTPPSPLSSPDQGRGSKNRHDVKRSRGPRDGDLGLCYPRPVPALGAA